MAKSKVNLFYSSRGQKPGMLLTVLIKVISKAVLLSEVLGGKSILLLFHLLVKAKVLATQSCLILCYTMDCSPPGSSVLEFSRREYWSGLSFPSLGDLPDPGIELRYPTLQADFLTTE